MSRELDAEVAEKVMGHSIHPSERIADWITPRYSSEIKPAWEVVEKMRELGFTFWMDNLGYTEQGCWRCEFDTKEPQMSGWGWVECATPSEAICRAALEAVKK